MSPYTYTLTRLTPSEHGRRWKWTCWCGASQACISKASAAWLAEGHMEESHG